MSMLTGRTEHRRSLFGKMILQVEFWAWSYRRVGHQLGYLRFWRDADYQDVLALARGDVQPEEPPKPYPPKPECRGRGWEVPVKVAPPEGLS